IDRDAELGTMCMPCQHQVNTRGADLSVPMGGVMAYQQPEFAGVRACYGLGQVTILLKAGPPVLHTDQAEALTVLLDRYMLIPQQPEPHGAVVLHQAFQVGALRRLAFPSGIVAIVVVPEDGILTIGCL